MHTEGATARQLMIWNIMSVDGYFEGDEHWDLELHTHIRGEDLRQLRLQFGENLGLSVFGRITYEGLAAHWSTTTDDPDIAQYMNASPNGKGTPLFKPGGIERARTHGKESAICSTCCSTITRGNRIE